MIGATVYTPKEHNVQCRNVQSSMAAAMHITSFWPQVSPGWLKGQGKGLCYQTKAYRVIS